MHRKDIGGNQTTGGKAVTQSLKVGNGITNAAVHKTMLATRDVARLLGIHANTVRRWANEGTLRATRIGSRGDRRFKREDIDRVSG